MRWQARGRLKLHGLINPPSVSWKSLSVRFDSRCARMSAYRFQQRAVLAGGVAPAACFPPGQASARHPGWYTAVWLCS